MSPIVAPTTRDDGRKYRFASAIVLMLCLVTMPALLPGYQLFQVAMFLAYAVALLGLNLLVGWTGQVSIGHGAFVAIGAYVTVYAVNAGVPLPAAIVVAAVVAFASGALLGVPALRLEGHILSLLTFVVAICLPQILRAPVFSHITGGATGLSMASPPSTMNFGMSFTPDTMHYLVCLIIFAIALFLADNLGNSRIGRALKSIRDQPIAAEALGVNVARYKVIIFGISAAFAGAAGGMIAIIVQFVSADSFSLFLSISLLVGVVVGGLGVTSGAIYGALFIQFVPNLAEDISTAIPWTVYGALLILVVFVAPGGFAGMIGSASRMLAARWSRPQGISQRET